MFFECFYGIVNCGLGEGGVFCFQGGVNLIDGGMGVVFMEVSEDF